MIPKVVLNCSKTKPHIFEVQKISFKKLAYFMKWKNKAFIMPCFKLSHPLIQ